jgi:hypothetical protein
MSDLGRRDSDHIDPVIEMRIQKVVADTRHRLINEITTLAAAQAAAKLQATVEHGEVRSDIQAMHTEVGALRRDLEQVLPLRESVEALHRRDEIEDARAQTSREILDELQKQRAQFRTFMVGASGVVIAACGVVVAIVT